MAKVGARKTKIPRRRKARGGGKGISPMFRLEGEVAGRRYQWANQADRQHIATLRMGRYVIERWRFKSKKDGDGQVVPDCPHPMSGLVGDEKAGAPIEQMGHVLMSCTQEDFDYIQQYGHDEEAGQARADLIEDLIIKKKGGVDPLRGLRGQHMRLAHDDQGLEHGDTDVSRKHDGVELGQGI